MWMMHLHINKKSDNDDDINVFYKKNVQQSLRE